MFCISSDCSFLPADVEYGPLIHYLHWFLLPIKSDPSVETLPVLVDMMLKKRKETLVCWCQESGLAVTLRLLSMRSREAAERLLPVLAPAAEALWKTSQQLAAWLLVHKEASAATEQAQAANVEAARLQVAVFSACLMVFELVSCSLGFCWQYPFTCSRLPGEDTGILDVAAWQLP